MENARECGFPRAGSKELPLICLAENAQLSDKATVTVSTHIQATLCVGGVDKLRRLTSSYPMQGLPCETYVIPFARMGCVVFINGNGKEREIWQEFTSHPLSAKYTEGMASVLAMTSGDALPILLAARSGKARLVSLSYVAALRRCMRGQNTRWLSCQTWRIPACTMTASSLTRPS